ncbi:DUF4175 family protein [Lichenicola cladoniae]|uniref:DUF4175 family protein n=1 Tax=Lichenicola cladoniae TaxID=1484109 RepID=A0A6M8HRW3_9PROT|nr:DUF4175 family protein [Lichenicola cladoniae]NPD65961.1 DUF4175 family protein [Acetobacteraceae bacterium]QKE91050.1 DUF4175 family protein [Lichenicola cladoniae]
MSQLPVLARARRQAGRVLWIEQIWPRLLPAIGVLIVVLIASLLTLPQRLPLWLHAALLLAIVACTGLLLYRRLVLLRAPGLRRRDDRIERASGLAHRPLLALGDQPAFDHAGNDATSRIWQAHLHRTEAGLSRLTAGPPRLGLRRHDRYRLGLPLLGVLVVCLLLAGREAPMRIASGFWPGLDIPLGPRPALQAWITPPDYAGGAPIFLTDPHGRYDVPAGATLMLSLTGLASRPRVSMQGTGPVRFVRLSPTSWTLGQPLTGSTVVSVRGAGYRLADWTITVQPILAPVVSWASPPGPATNEPWQTKLPWSVSHRYGVQTLMAELRLTKPGRRDQPERVVRVPIPMPGSTKSAKGVALPDLSADPWAGEPVTARLLATDASGQTGRSADAAFTLPARPFRNPLARAVLDVRRRLALGREQPAEAADDLQALGDTPGAFAQDSSLFLNLSADASLLRLQPASPAATDEGVSRLWELALALEDGLHNDRDGARAALDVRAAQDGLSAQLEHMRQLGDRGQSDPEQAKLRARIDALTAAIAHRMQALAAQAQREHTALPPMPDQKMLGGQDLARMLQQMRDAAAAGHPQEAMQMLSRMQAMLEHMRAATPRDLESARQQAQAQQQAKEQMEAVQDLVQRQTALLDHAQSRQNQADAAEQARAGTQQDGEDAVDPATRDLMRQLGIPEASLPPRRAPPQAGSPPGSPQQSPSQGTPQAGATGPDQQSSQKSDGHAQHVLRRALGELSTEFKSLTGKAAAGLNDASKAMDRARDALSAGQDAPAVTAQMQALASLQKGAQQMRSAMSGSGSGGGSGMALLPGDGQSGSGTGSEPGQDEASGAEQDGKKDPLGRHLASGHAGMDDGSDTHVPDATETGRSREIERELRRRDSDRTRPQPELDYLDRLLKPF